MTIVHFLKSVRLKDQNETESEAKKTRRRKTEREIPHAEGVKP
jgi:hypothetical protein